MTHVHAAVARQGRWGPISLVVSAVVAAAFCCFPPSLWGDVSSRDLSRLIKTACLDCHGKSTETGLDLESLGHDLSNAGTFRTWERVFDRVRSGEMPPESEPRPDPRLIKAALASLEGPLRSASLARQTRLGRVTARRLTKLELEYTLRDLLGVEGEFTENVPDEVESGTFDTVGATQRVSAVHMHSYLQAVDLALGAAIRLGKNPYRSTANNYSWLQEWHDKPLQLGGNITRGLMFGDGIALFADIDYLTGFQFPVRDAGIHRLTARVAAYQSATPVTVKIIVKNQTGSARLVKSHDLVPGEPETLVVETFLRPR